MKKPYLILALSLLFFPGLARGARIWSETIPPTIPRGAPEDPRFESILLLRVGCYEIRTKEPLNCGFIFDPPQVVHESGGHDHHDANRPVGGFRWEDTRGSGSPTLSGQTGYQEVGVEYVAPEVAGEVTIYTTFLMPPEHFCVDPPDCQFIGKVQLVVEWFHQMPSSPEGYWRLVGSWGEEGVTSQHTLNHSGRNSTLKKMEQIAREFYQETGIAIRINDLSLPQGGLFDINNNWMLPHSWHRLGKSVDVSRFYLKDGVLVELDKEKEKRLDEIAQRKYHCKRYEREIRKIHYECPLD